MGYRVDLNADVGEGCDDDAVLPFVTSVNVACGGHAGDESTMQATVEAARARGIAIGAHPSYPDREHFGRRELALAPADVEACVRQQVLALAAWTSKAGVKLVHVKPHGALYNVAARDPPTAQAVVRAVRSVDAGLRVIGLAGSQLLDAAAQASLRAAGEAFADRRYAADGSLTPRSLAGAVIEDGAVAAEQALRIVRDREVDAVDGTRIRIHAQTLCIHGDSPRAAEIARAVHERLRDAGIELRALDR
jgi:UPF0271 protein